MIKADESIQVDVWSDVACPWCWVGKRNLEAACAQANVPVEVKWRAFELNPNAPPKVDAAVSYLERLARKYRVAESEAQAMVDRMTGVGESVGLEFRFDRVQITNTFDAHRLLSWAGTVGDQGALKERLFRAYMNEGRLLSDHDVLVAQAAQCGLDGEAARAVLAEGRFADEVRTDEGAAAHLQIQGVPFYVVGGRYAISGAQPAEVLASALKELTDAQLAPDAGGPTHG